MFEKYGAQNSLVAQLELQMDKFKNNENEWHTKCKFKVFSNSKVKKTLISQ